MSAALGANAAAVAALKLDDQAYAAALTFVLTEEGCHLPRDTGRVNDADDPGGATNYGITQGTYDAWRAYAQKERADVNGIGLDEVAAIYRRNYWRDSRAALFAAHHPLLALAHMDAAGNLGLVQAARCLQRAVGCLTIDGVIGPKTLALIEASNDKVVVGRYLVDRANVYRQIVERRPASQKFLKGWLARCRHVARACGVEIDPAYQGTA